MRENLVIVRAGDTSLHRKWIHGRSRRNFDIYVSYYGNKRKSDPGADYYERSSGLKYPRLASLFKENDKLLRSYKAYWLPDDDLLTDTRTICSMFDLFHQYNLWLAQPALGNGSYFSHHITRASYGSSLRFTNFVEIMCPIFSNSCLLRLWNTFELSASGWGLGVLWPHILGYPRDKIGILDATPVTHTRPVGNGGSYRVCNKLGVNPYDDLRRICRQYKLKLDFHNYLTIPKVQ